ncbi:diguanylate cyclase [Paraglaciecola sp. 20A4]|uniref:sensor domain-containing diguanylate cyclase n=1 Tax=Paraglaciecola sp. 20A4 TaxID=2687288 RepID=UPI001407BC8A|nr:diguanylate cyclase [Paraglaciecola sp. 20A4]
MPTSSKSHIQAMDITKSIPRASAVLLVCVLLAVVFNIATLMTEVLSDKSVPQAIQGKIDLTTIELSEIGSVPLSGNWEFYWQKLLTPSQIDNSKNEPTYIDVPHAWVRSTLDGQPLPTHGVATYHVNIFTDKKYANLSLKVPTIGTAYKLYIDDNLVSEGGKVGLTQKTSEPGYNPEIILFEPKSDKFSITIQVSNHDYYWGGTWTTVRLGVSHNIHQEQYRQILRSSFLLAVFLTVAIFNLIQFTLRTTDPLPILIALTCILLGLREIESSQILYFTGIAHWSFATNARINFLSFYAASPLVIAYFHITFWQEYNKKLMAVIYALCTIASLCVVFTPPEIFSQTISLFQVLIILVMPYVLWGLIKAVKNKRYSARILTMGTMFLFAFIFNDILFSLDMIDTTIMISFGLVTFILCQNYLTYTRFINASKQNKYLSIILEERNNELQNFSQSLEEKVKKRTDELANANEKLGELAHKDMLTGLPNRRGMMVFIEESIIHHRQSDTPFCLLILDFDKFKKLNDTLGHEEGDRVLSEGSTLMRQVLRDQDEVARWGGEEFLILLPSTPLTGAVIIANKLKNSLKETLTKSIGIPVSVTIGVAEFEKADTLGSCFKRADKALYLGKKNGRDKVVLAEPGETQQDQ